ncbi:putative membrane protein [Thermacetogenium phaeum DSM 12270]|uniref:Putative membrane protein n=2 Tax=Thermacetogenium phaeum TaxID=85874 RepID=K4LVA0_THEPS|nr:putative membrane protein [Thermacetogenium phaeum DSM 12270]
MFLHGKFLYLEKKTGGIRFEMLKMNRLIIVLLFVLIIGAGGFAAPFLFIQEKLPGLSSEEKVVTEYAVLQVRQLIGGSLEPLVAFRFKVTNITRKPGESLIYLPPDETPGSVRFYKLKCAYEVTVDAYTFFGIRYSQFIVDTGKSSISRTDKL